ncbi:MAG: DIP1984 family protein [Oscillospiraceae bacterium]|nr:DIP1984 family protein [Oscillospiraceae bacterium]
MKLAEALQERADINRRIAQLRSRLMNNALTQEGELPAEDPNELLTELDGCVARLEKLIGDINHANCNTVVDGCTLTQLIAQRDALTMKLQAYRELVSEASCTAQRATRSEIRILSSVDVRALQKKVDAMSKQLRELDAKIQMTNWTTDI